MFGLKQNDIESIISILQNYAEVEEAVIFGSRAKGNFKNGSDVDIALKGKVNIQVINHIAYTLNEETLMPYRFDVVDYHTIRNEVLKEHIDKAGKILYTRNISLQQWEKQK